MKKYRHLFLAGTAILAINAFGSDTAYAQSSINVSSSGQWAENGTALSDGSLANAASGDSIFIIGNGVDITVENDGVASDQMFMFGPPTFTIDSITDNSPAEDGDLIVRSGAGGDTTATVVATVIDGNISVLNNDIDNAGSSLTSDTFDIGGNLTITNNESATSFVVVDATSENDINVAETQSLRPVPLAVLMPPFW